MPDQDSSSKKHHDALAERITSSSLPDISILVPALNEQETLEDLVGGIRHGLKSIPRLRFEIILIDDGSTDLTWSVMTQLAQTHSFVRAIRLRRNFGKAAALSAGLDRARGKIIITMDADLQDDPAEIPNFLARLGQGFDLVNGWKQVRHDPISKTLPSRFFNGLMRAVFRLPLHDINCGFKAGRREVFDTIPLHGELHRFIPVFVNNAGFRITEIAVQHHPRRAGKSKYGMERFLRGIIDMLTVVALTEYRWRPGHLFGILALLIGASGGIIFLYLLADLLVLGGSNQIPNILIMIFLAISTAAQLFCLGSLAELFIIHTSPPKPEDFIAEERIGKPPSPQVSNDQSPLSAYGQTDRPSGNTT